jgi:hypothetical protein
MTMQIELLVIRTCSIDSRGQIVQKHREHDELNADHEPQTMVLAVIMHP